jgi:hypothetical protein
MFYILTKPGEELVYPYTLTDLMRANPGTSFPRDMTNFDASDWHCYPVQDTTPPEAPGKVAQRIMAKLINGIWHECWELVDAPLEPVPTIVTMRQARLVLLQAGLLDQVEGILAAIEDSFERSSAQITWEYSTEVERDNPLVILLSSAFNLTTDQVDSMFRQAINL